MELFYICRAKWPENVQLDRPNSRNRMQSIHNVRNRTGSSIGVLLPFIPPLALIPLFVSCLVPLIPTTWHNFVFAG